MKRKAKGIPAEVWPQLVAATRVGIFTRLLFDALVKRGLYVEDGMTVEQVAQAKRMFNGWMQDLAMDSRELLPPEPGDDNRVGWTVILVHCLAHALGEDGTV